MVRSDFGLGDAGLAELLAARAAMIAPLMLRNPLGSLSRAAHGPVGLRPRRCRPGGAAGCQGGHDRAIHVARLLRQRDYRGMHCQLMKNDSTRKDF